MDLKPVFYVVGILLTILSMSMVFPMLTDLYFGTPDWKVFFACIVITAFFGGSLVLSNYEENINLSTRQAFLITVAAWVAIALFGALPFYLSELQLNITDSFFESMSGVTTTGSTVITNLEGSPPGILLWRAILQWLGGIGIIIMALSVMPFLKVGGMQIFKTELSENEKALPRLAQLTTYIAIIYAGLTILCTILYGATGWDFFTSITHAMTTISTGGFSTFDSSFDGHDTVWREIVCIIFMIIGSLPFVLYLKLLRGNAQPLFTDEQVRWFFAILFTAIFSITIYLILEEGHSPGRALLETTFSATTLMTGTGFVNADYGSWGQFAPAALFFLMVVGGCAGSTSCGMKVFRVQVLYSIMSIQVKRLLHPHGVFFAHYNGKPIPREVPIAVMGFFFIFALSFSFIAIALSLTGLEFLEAMSSAATAIANVGPGLGEVGPTGNFAGLTDPAKWIMAFGMLLGRLEIFPVLVMMYPAFWQR